MRLRDWNGEFGNAKWWAQTLGLSAIAGVVLGVFGPFGSYLNGNITLRIFSWVGNLTGGVIILGVVVPLIVRGLRRLNLPLLFCLAVAIVVATGPTSLFCALFANWLWPQAVHGMRPEDWFGQSLIVEIVMVALWLLAVQALQRRSPVGEALAETAPPDTQPVFCLQMEDHYVRVHQGRGSRLELMPLHDAIARYGQTPGLKVHRSWWVAREAITGVERDGRNVRLRLSNGLIVPVARNRIADLRAMGIMGGED